MNCEWCNDESDRDGRWLNLVLANSYDHVCQASVILCGRCVSQLQKVNRRHWDARLWEIVERHLGRVAPVTVPGPPAPEDYDAGDDEDDP